MFPFLPSDRSRQALDVCVWFGVPKVVDLQIDCRGCTALVPGNRLKESSPSWNSYQPSSKLRAVVHKERPHWSEPQRLIRSWGQSIPVVLKKWRSRFCLWSHNRIFCQNHDFWTIVKAHWTLGFQCFLRQENCCPLRARSFTSFLSFVFVSVCKQNLGTIKIQGRER